MGEHSSAERVPFLLNFLERVEPKRYEGALAQMRTLSSSYDETTQTSQEVDPEAGGTSATYTDDIATGLFSWDTKRTDW